MAKPALSGNLNTFFVSAAQVLYKGSDIGFVSGVKIKIKHETTETKTDQLGKTIANHFHVGDNISCEMMMDELTAARLKTAFGFAKLLTTGPASRITWGTGIGGNFFSQSGTLQIRPTVDDTTNTLRNFYFYKASPVGDSEVTYSPDGKAQIKVTFFCYPDLAKPDGEFFGYFGDITGGSIVPAAFGAVTPGGGNVGNGTLGSIAVNDQFTVSETWTATCIKAVTNGGLFAVSGSVTGARGNATVGSNFYSNSINPSNSEVQFLISDGTTDFAVGDTFSFPVTAKQYV